MTPARELVVLTEALARLAAAHPAVCADSHTVKARLAHLERREGTAAAIACARLLLRDLVGTGQGAVAGLHDATRIAVEKQVFATLDLPGVQP